MKRKLSALTAVVMFFSAAAVLPVKAEDAYQNQKDEVVMLVNEERALYGLPALFESELLNQAAQIRAEEIVKNFSHQRPDGRNGYTAFTDLGGTYWEVGENLASGQTTEKEVVKAWMNSEYHRENILFEKFEAIDIGVAKGTDGIYWVQIFTDGKDLTPLYTNGNINRDGSTNAQDAALVLVNAASRGAGNAEILNRMQKQFADVNHDSQVNASDAAGILSYAAFVGAGGTEEIETYLNS